MRRTADNNGNLPSCSSGEFMKASPLECRCAAALLWSEQLYGTLYSWLCSRMSYGVRYLFMFCSYSKTLHCWLLAWHAHYSIFICEDMKRMTLLVAPVQTCPVCVCVLPVCPCKGECGRGRVGEVLDVTIRLFLLLVRQLGRKKNTLKVLIQIRDSKQRWPTSPILIGSSRTMAPPTWPLLYRLWKEMTPLIQDRRCRIRVLLLHRESGNMGAIFVYCLLIT